MAEVAGKGEVPKVQEEENDDNVSYVEGDSLAGDSRSDVEENFYEPGKGQEEEEEEEEDEEAPKPKTPVVELKAKKEVKKEKKKRPQPIPKDSKGFFRARKNDVKRFDFTADGDLQVPEMNGQPPKVIKLPFYIPATEEEIQAIDDARQVSLEAIEEEYNETLKNLREALVGWRETNLATPVIQLQRELLVLDAKRSQLRSPVRWTKNFKNPSVNEILFELDYENRKIGYDVTGLVSRHYTPEQLLKKSEVAPPKPDRGVKGEEEVFAKPAKAGPTVTYALFNSRDDSEHGFLAPDYEVKFVFNGTKYWCILQAYEGERLTFLKRTDKKKVILMQKTGKAIRSTAVSVVGDVENPMELWKNIITTMIAQHPSVGEELRETGKDTLVYAEATDGKAGIGLDVNDPNALQESKWKGQNLLGKAWMAARAELPEGELEGQQGGAFEEDGTLALQEQAEKTKRGVLIHRYKMNQQSAHP